MTRRTLVAGFGNIYRRDDGVGAAVVNGVRRRCGMSPLTADDDGFDDLGRPLDAILLHQLVPELAETAAAYDLVVFVDAHVGTVHEDVREERLVACYRPTTISHQLHPCTVLALALQLYGREPEGVLVSVRGHDFEFGEGLSEKTEALVPLAVDRILSLATSEIGHA